MLLTQVSSPLPHAPSRCAVLCTTGRFVHTRNMSGLTDKCAQRMTSLLLSGGDSDAGPIPGLPSEAVGSSASSGFPIGNNNGAGPSRSEHPEFPSGCVSPTFKPHQYRNTPPSTSQTFRNRQALGGGHDNNHDDGYVGDGGVAAGIRSSLGLQSASQDFSSSPPPRSPLGSPAGGCSSGEGRHHHDAHSSTYLGGTPGMGGLSVGMSPIQRSIFRGGHDPTGGASSRVVPNSPSPQIRGHTAAGGRITLGGASPPFGSPFASGHHAGASSFDGASRLPHVRTAAPHVNRASTRSQTASVGFGRPQQPYYSFSGGRSGAQIGGGGGQIPSHLGPRATMGSL